MPTRSRPRSRCSTTASPAARATRASSGCTTTAAGPRGPCTCRPARSLVWSDIPNDRMLRWDETTGAVGVFRHPCGYTNGHTLDAEGRIVSCEHGGRRVTPHRARRLGHDARRPHRRQAAEQPQRRRRASRTARSGSPTRRYGIDSDYEGHRAESEIDGCHVYRIDPVTGAVTRRRRRLRATERPGLLARRADALHRRHATQPHPPVRGRRRRPPDRRGRVRRVHGRRLRRLPPRHRGPHLGGGAATACTASIPTAR